MDDNVSSGGKARRLLDAWKRQDLQALSAALQNSAYGAGGRQQTTAVEQERLEFLESIRDEMLKDLADIQNGRRKSTYTETHVRLLEHLAATAGESIYSI